MNSSRVGEGFNSDNLNDYTWYLEELLRLEQPVLVYAGEFDSQDGPKTQEIWMRDLNFDGSDEFWLQSR